MKNWTPEEVAVLERMNGKFSIHHIAAKLRCSIDDVKQKLEEESQPVEPAKISAEHEKQLAWLLAETHELMRNESYGSVTAFIDKGRILRVEKKVSVMNPNA